MIFLAASLLINVLGAASIFAIEKLAYRVTEAAQATGLGERSIWRAIAVGSLPAVKHGRATLILASTLKAWLRGQEMSPDVIQTSRLDEVTRGKRIDLINEG